MNSVPRTNPTDIDDGIILLMMAERIRPLTDEEARLASAYALRYLAAAYALRYLRAGGTVADLEALLLFAGIPARSSETAS